MLARRTIKEERGTKHKVDKEAVALEEEDSMVVEAVLEELTAEVETLVEMVGADTLVEITGEVLAVIKVEAIQVVLEVAIAAATSAVVTVPVVTVPVATVGTASAAAIAGVASEATAEVALMVALTEVDRAGVIQVILHRTHLGDQTEGITTETPIGVDRVGERLQIRQTPPEGEMMGMIQSHSEVCLVKGSSSTLA